MEVKATGRDVELGITFRKRLTFLILGDEAKVGFARGIVTEDRAGDCGRVDPAAAGDEVG